MTDALQRRLFDEGKELYKLRNLPCPEECLMGWGICCPDEWFPQLLALTRILERHNRLHPEEADCFDLTPGKYRFHEGRMQKFVRGAWKTYHSEDEFFDNEDF